MKLQKHQKSNFLCLEKVHIWTFAGNWFKIWIGKLSDITIKIRSYKTFKCCFQNLFSSFRSENTTFFNMSFSAQDPVVIIVLPIINLLLPFSFVPSPLHPPSLPLPLLWSTCPFPPSSSSSFSFPLFFFYLPRLSIFRRLYACGNGEITQAFLIIIP